MLSDIEQQRDDTQSRLNEADVVITGLNEQLENIQAQRQQDLVTMEAKDAEEQELRDHVPNLEEQRGDALLRIDESESVITDLNEQLEANAAVVLELKDHET